MVFALLHLTRRFNWAACIKSGVVKINVGANNAGSIKSMIWRLIMGVMPFFALNPLNSTIPSWKKVPCLFQSIFWMTSIDYLTQYVDTKIAELNNMPVEVITPADLEERLDQLPTHTGPTNRTLLLLHKRWLLPLIGAVCWIQSHPTRCLFGRHWLCIRHAAVCYREATDFDTLGASLLFLNNDLRSK